jgi:hypothetical protein
MTIICDATVEDGSGTTWFALIILLSLSLSVLVAIIVGRWNKEK